MDKKEIDAVRELKARSSAFSNYLENGIGFVEKFYPNQLDFVLENKDRSFDEVRNIIKSQFSAKTQH